MQLKIPMFVIFLTMFLFVATPLDISGGKLFGLRGPADPRATRLETRLATATDLAPAPEDAAMASNSPTKTP